MIGDPAPVGFLIIGDPIPAIVISIDPMAGRVGTPIARDVCRYPHIAEAFVMSPRPIRLERRTEIDRYRNLLRGGRSD
jgi:hypothetical protein